MFHGTAFKIVVTTAKIRVFPKLSYRDSKEDRATFYLPGEAQKEYTVHSSSKFRVFATEAFCTEKSTEISNIQLKFQMKPTNYSSRFQKLRSFDFCKIYKFETKRDLHRNISGIGQ
jgi:hypothetical protein